MRLRTAIVLGVAAVPFLVVAPSCSRSNSAGPSDAATLDEQDAGVEDAEPVICTEFTEAGAPCPVASPVTCFQECEAGGCSCRERGPGQPPVWVCTVDTSCLPDCAPLDDGCSPVIYSGDDGPDDGPGDAVPGDDGPADAPVFDAGDAGAATDAADASG